MITIPTYIDDDDCQGDNPDCPKHGRGAARSAEARQALGLHPAGILDTDPSHPCCITTARMRRQKELNASLKSGTQIGRGSREKIGGQDAEVPTRSCRAIWTSQRCP